MRRFLNLCVFLFIFIIGLGGGVYLERNFLHEKHNLTSRQIRSGEVSYINPLLECEIGADAFQLTGLDHIRRELIDLIDSKKSMGEIDSASIYFRDLNNGPWFGIGEHDKFSPASLLKLPVAITIYKIAEGNRDFLSEKIEYDYDFDNPDEIFSPKSDLEKGKSYTIKELVVRMLQNSDNIATVLITDKIGGDKVLATMHDMGVEIDNTDPSQNIITVQGYATMYRVLFNSSYLTQDSSNEILSILTKSSFKGGIVKSIPASIKVAHKYGEREMPGVNQLHDCGIVYYKRSPYSLCIMTKGQDLNKLVSFIASTSKIVYDGVSEKYK